MTGEELSAVRGGRPGLGTACGLLVRRGRRGLLVFGGGLVASDGLTVGSLVAARSLLAGIVAGVAHVVGTWVSYQGTTVAAERLRDLLLVEPESTGGRRSLERVSSVSLRGLSFDWPSGDPLFHNVDVTLDPGVVVK